MLDLSPYPDTPVNPDEFTSTVLHTLKVFEVFVSDDMPEVIKQLCGLLNLSVTNPEISPVLANKKIWAFPAQTGIGKSVCLKVYAAMLKDFGLGSLIVLAKKSEVKEYAENINYAVQSHEYAACLYYPVNKDDKHPYLQEAQKEWKKYKTLLITHKRYEDLAGKDEEEIDFIRLYENEDGELVPRQLVVIDEKLPFFKSTAITMDEFKEVNSFLENALTHTLAENAVCQSNQLTDQLSTIYELLSEYEPISDSKPIKSVEAFYLREAILEKGLDEAIDYDLVEKIVDTRLNEFFQEIQAISRVKESEYQGKVFRMSKTLPAQLGRILIETAPGSEFFYRDFVLFWSSGVHLLKVKNLFQPFGTAVVLDATASVSEFYRFADRNSFSQIALIDVQQFRKYANLKIYKASGYSQSRHGLMADTERYEQSAEFYSNAAKSILEEDDQLLIITYQKLVGKLREKMKDESNVFLTHWGAHVGTNEWNECNKVMVVGWNFLPPIETLSRIYGSGAGTNDLRITQSIDKEVIRKFSVTQIVDDLVQGVMRSRARKIATSDSDCQTASVYLFCPDNPVGNDVMDLFEQQFPDAAIEEWMPDIEALLVKKGPIQRNADLVLAVIDKYAQANDAVLWNTVWNEAGLNSNKANRVRGDAYFHEELNKKGYEFSKINGKSFQIKFR